MRLYFLQGNSITGFQVKETTTGFYAWMKREVKALYATAFQRAFEVAKKAERAIHQNEIGDPNLSFIRYNYLDGTEGLRAGEKLMLDLKAVELAYQDLNQREYELTKHVSRVAAPLQLCHSRTSLISKVSEARESWAHSRRNAVRHAAAIRHW